MYCWRIERLTLSYGNHSAKIVSYIQNILTIPIRTELIGTVFGFPTAAASHQKQIEIYLIYLFWKYISLCERILTQCVSLI